MKPEICDIKSQEGRSMNKKLKRILSAAAIAAAVTAVGATSAFAAGTGTGRNFTDTNGDNICDNCAANQTDCILQNGTGKNYADTEDIFQTVFLKYALSSVIFESEEHEKAWFLRVTINACKDLLKSFFRNRTVPLDELIEQPAEMPPDYREVLEAVLALPSKYKDAVYLHYYEGYTAPEISRILGKNVNTVYTLLNRSRQLCF